MSVARRGVARSIDCQVSGTNSCSRVRGPGYSHDKRPVLCCAVLCCTVLCCYITFFSHFPFPFSFCLVNIFLMTDFKYILILILLLLLLRAHTRHRSSSRRCLCMCTILSSCCRSVYSLQFTRPDEFIILLLLCSAPCTRLS